MIFAYYWKLKFLMRAIRRQLSLTDFLFLCPQQTAILTILTFCIELRHLNLGSCVRVRLNTHTHTNEAQSVKHTTFHVSLLNSSLSKRWQRHQQCCRKEAANRKLVGCKENEASDNELKRRLSQYFIVSPWLVQSKHEWAVHTLAHARKHACTSPAGVCLTRMVLMSYFRFII